VGGIWGQTRYLGAWVFDSPDLPKPQPDGRGCWGTRIWGQARCRVYRSGTFNVQRSTLNFQCDDRKGARWAGYGDRHGIWAPGFLARRTCPSHSRTVEATGAPGYGDRHDVGYIDQERSTSNVQLSTFNGVTERAHGGIWGQTRYSEQERGQTRYLGAWVFGSPDLPKPQPDGRGCWGTRIWGQARCRVYRSGTFNVQRSTLNFQCDDRNGARWAGYGDRHVIWAPGFLTRRTCQSNSRTVEAAGAPGYGAGTMSGISIRNVQRPTFNSQLSM